MATATKSATKTAAKTSDSAQEETNPLAGIYEGIEGPPRKGFEGCQRRVRRIRNE